MDKQPCAILHTHVTVQWTEREKASQSQHATSHVKKYQRQYYRYNPRFFNEITSELMGCTHSDRARGTGAQRLRLSMIALGFQTVKNLSYTVALDTSAMRLENACGQCPFLNQHTRSRIRSAFASLGPPKFTGQSYYATIHVKKYQRQ